MGFCFLLAGCSTHKRQAKANSVEDMVDEYLEHWDEDSGWVMMMGVYGPFWPGEKTVERIKAIIPFGDEAVPIISQELSEVTDSYDCLALIELLDIINTPASHRAIDDYESYLLETDEDLWKDMGLTKRQLLHSIEVVKGARELKDYQKWREEE